MVLNQANRALALPFPFGLGPRGDVMVGWWPETLCQLMAISPKPAPFRLGPAYHIALPKPKDYGSAADHNIQHFNCLILCSTMKFI
jgi:hypothetical protein